MEEHEHLHPHPEEHGQFPPQDHPEAHEHGPEGHEHESEAQVPGQEGHEHSRPHGHYHDPEEKKRQLNRLARAIGHLQHVKAMIERDEDCADVLMQLSAVNAALKNLGKEIINEHMTHCIAHAIADGDMELVEEFRKAVQQYI